MALFCTNVCVCAKKAVLLQPLLKKNVLLNHKANFPHTLSGG